MSKSKKIALIGNSNNNFFSLVRFLRDRGFCADLFLLNNELSHFHPSCDTYSLDFMDYTYCLPFGNCYWFGDEIEGLKKDKSAILTLKDYDVIFACGSSLAYLEAFDIGVDFFVPYGMDLVHYPFFVPSANPNHRAHLDAFCDLQRQAILRSRYVLSTQDILGVTEYKESIEKLQCKTKTIVFKTFPYIYDKIYAKSTIPKYFSRSYWAEDFLKFKRNSQFLVFHHERHTWRSCAGRVGDKRNDKMFRGFAEALPQIKTLKPKILTFEYGDDVFWSKALIKELGIEKYVKWLPLMNRKDIMVGLHCANVATGQFRIGCVGGGGAN